MEQSETLDAGSLDALIRDAVEELRFIKRYGDTEREHIAADKVLCDLLKTLGCEEVVKEWETVDKWYT